MCVFGSFQSHETDILFLSQRKLPNRDIAQKKTQNRTEQNKTKRNKHAHNTSRIDSEKLSLIPKQMWRDKNKTSQIEEKKNTI